MKLQGRTFASSFWTIEVMLKYLGEALKIPDILQHIKHQLQKNTFLEIWHRLIISKILKHLCNFVKCNYTHYDK